MAIRRSHNKRRFHKKRRSCKKRHCKRGGDEKKSDDSIFHVYGEGFDNPEQNGRGAFFITIRMQFNNTVRDLFEAVNRCRAHQNLPFELRVGNEHGEPIPINDVTIANIAGDNLWMVQAPDQNAHDLNYVFRPH